MLQIIVQVKAYFLQGLFFYLSYSTLCSGLIVAAADPVHTPSALLSFELRATLSTHNFSRKGLLLFRLNAPLCVSKPYQLLHSGKLFSADDSRMHVLAQHLRQFSFIVSLLKRQTPRCVRFLRKRVSHVLLVLKDILYRTVLPIWGVISRLTP